MPSSMIERIYAFQKEIEYSDHNIRPLPVARGTASIMFLYFNHKDDDFDISSGKEFLITHTLPLIDAIRQGLAKHPDRVDKLVNASFEDANRATQFDREITTDQESLEALDMALITMAEMPSKTHTFRNEIMGERVIEFSRRGMLQSPSTLEETRGRIRELWTETQKIALGWTSPNEPVYVDPRRVRMLMFFNTASNINLENTHEGDRDVAKNFPDILAQKYIPGE